MFGLGLGALLSVGSLLTAIPIIGPFLGAGGTVVAKIAKAIPWQVYVTIILIIGVAYYGHWSRQQGRMQGRAEIVALTAKAAKAEVARQTKAKDVIIQAETKRADAAVAANAELQRKVDDAIAKANASPTAGRDCLPPDSLRRLRNLR